MPSFVSALPQIAFEKKTLNLQGQLAIDLSESSLDEKPKDRTKIFSPLVTLSLTLVSIIFIGASVIPFELVNGQNTIGQNTTDQMENASAIYQVDIDVL